jgi:hypothetical protein
LEEGEPLPKSYAEAGRISHYYARRFAKKSNYEGRCKKEVPVVETLNVVIISVVVLMKHKIFATQTYNKERERLI